MMQLTDFRIGERPPRMRAVKRFVKTIDIANLYLSARLCFPLHGIRPPNGPG